MNGVRRSENAVRCSAFCSEKSVFCSAGVLFGMRCSSIIGCFARRFVRPRGADLDLYGVLFGVGVLFGYSVLFGVLFVEKMLCSCSQVWTEQCSCSANVVRLQSWFPQHKT